MAFEAATHGGNPFLMDEDFALPVDNGASNIASNPFLSSGDFDMPTNGNAAELNPFLCGMDDTYPDANSTSTNPFAMFGVEETDQTFVQVNNDNIFGDEPSNVQENEVNFFGDEPEPTPLVQQQPQVPTADFFASPERPAPPRPQPPIVAPSSLPLTGEAVEYCAETANIFQDQEEEVEKKSPSIPGRPPPPRPVPPSKETQQLILSVTGAMEATSSDLLDRLRATKTPSPTPIRDLHSPSPTPEMGEDFLGDQEADLMMGDDTPAPPPPSATLVDDSQPQTASNFMDIFGSAVEERLPTPPEPEQQEFPPPPVEMVQETVSQGNDFFSIFGAEPTPPAAPAVATGPPPRPPAPPVIVKPLTPPQEANLLGDFTSPNSSDINAIVETTAPVAVPVSVAIAPKVPGPPKVPPRPPSPNIPVNASTFQQPEPAPAFQNARPATTTYNQSPAEPYTSPSAPATTVYTSPPAPATVEVSEYQQPPAPEVNYASHVTNDAFNQNDTFNQTSVPPTSGFGAALFGDVAPSTEQSMFGDVPPNTKQNDDFDAFAAKFENAEFGDTQGVEKKDPFFDAFGASVGGVGDNGAWGNDANDNGAKTIGFGGEEDQFDAFLSLSEPPPVPQSTPARNTRQESADSDEGDNLHIFIKPKMGGSDDVNSHMQLQGPVPILAPPPRSPEQNSAFADNTPRFNPFDNGAEVAAVPMVEATPVAPLPVRPPDMGTTFQRTDSQETPQTPLFDEDVSQPLEEFPRVNYVGEGWEMHLRHPNKKKITGQRFWKKVFVRLVYQGDNPVLQLSNTKEDKDPFQELPLQPCYSISDIGAQQFDQYGKIFTVKLQYVFYKERPGVRPGQVTKAERITNKLSQFAAYAIQGDYQGVKEFGSDLRKLGLPVEHAPQISQLLKIGSQNYEDMKQFSITIEEALFRMPAHRDRALNYKMEEVQITAVDELYLEQDMTGHVCKQIARVRVFFLGFISGMPDLELGVNDIMRQGKEVVGRHDIIPVVTEEWIRLENLEFHSCVLNNEYEGARVIKFKPPDACYIELLRFRVRPPKNRELPLQLKCVICVTGNKVEIKCDILVPGFSSRKLGQIPCEDIMVRIPIPESWIYLFRVEKHFRYGSVKSAHRRTGKIKGIERFLGTMETLEQSLIEVTSGSAKYEHQHHAIVWRIARLPKEGQGAYTNHEFVCRFTLTSFDQIPEELAKYCYLEFTMPSTQVSHTTVRSLSVLGDRDEDPPEKCVRHLARLEYRIEIEHTQGSNPNSYLAATQVKSTPEPVIEKPEHEKESDSDSSS